MDNNKIDNPIAYIDKDDAFVTENYRAKEGTTYNITEKHSPKYFRITDQDNIYKYLNGDLSTNSTKGGKDIPFKIAAGQIDDASKYLYKNQRSYKDILNLDRTYNLDKRIFDYTSDKLMREWNSINSQMENIYQQYSLGNVTPRKMRRAANKYDKAVNKYNGYFKNLFKNATHFRYADSINNGVSVVNGKGPLYDKMTRGIWGLMNAYIGAGFAPATVPKIVSATPWIVRNIVVPGLGAEILNEATRTWTDHNSVGDLIYTESGLKHLLDDTWAEKPVRYMAEILNPGYYASYGKMATSLFNSIPNWVEGKAYNIVGDLVGTQIYKNPAAIKPAENILQMIPQQHRNNFAQGVINGNKTATLNAQNPSQWFTTGGMPNPETTLYSGFPYVGPLKFFRNVKSRSNLSPYIFPDYKTAINSPEILTKSINGMSKINGLEIVDPTLQQKWLIRPAWLNVKYKTNLNHFSYLAKLSEPDKKILSTYRPRDKFLANRLFKYLDREGLLKYYWTPDGTLTFTPEEEILHLTKPEKAFVSDVGNKVDPNYDAIEWLAMDKWRKETLDWLASQDKPIDFNTLVDLDNALTERGYFRKNYSNFKSDDLHIPNMSSAWMDLDSEMAGARMYHRNQMLERARRRVKWPMRTNTLTPMELIGVPKHERTMIKRPNIGVDLPSDLRLYRVTEGFPSIVNGKIRHLSSGPRYIRGIDNKPMLIRPMSNTLHLTSDQLVTSHSSGNWDNKGTVLINSMGNFAKENGYPIGLEPMDTFFSTQTPTIPTNGLTVLTNNLGAATAYRLMGAKTFLNTTRYNEPSTANIDYYMSLPYDHPYSYLWPYKQFSGNYSTVTDVEKISSHYKPDIRLGGFRHQHPTLSQYTDVANIIGEDLRYTITDNNGKLVYEGAPKNHSFWPNAVWGSWPSVQLDRVSPIYRQQFLESLKRGINKGTIQINEEQKRNWLERYENTEFYDDLINALDTYAPDKVK